MASGPPFPPPLSPYDPASSPYSSAPGAQGAGEYQWLAPASLPNASGRPGEAGRFRPAPMYELRPLSTGEVLDRTFSLYRSRFLLFAGIASLSAAVQLLGQAVQLVVMHSMMKGRTDLLTLATSPMSRGYQVANNLLSGVSSLVFLLAFAITQAATIWAMGEVYLGRSATVSSSLRATASRWLRYLGIAFWQLGSLVWLPLAVMAAFAAIWFANGRSLGGFAVGTLLVLLLIASFVIGFLFYLRNLLAVPVTVREGAGVRASMRRSKVLANGGKGKLFVVLLVALGLYMVVATLAGVGIAVTAAIHRGNFMGIFFPAQIIGIVVGFAGYTLISPVVMIGTGLVYFDQRVRKEAFDVAVLLGEESVGPVLAPVAGPVLQERPGYVAAESMSPLGATGPVSPSYEAPVSAVPTLETPSGEAPLQAESTPAEPAVTEPEGGASGL